MSEHKFSWLGTSKETDFSRNFRAMQGDLTFSYPLLIYSVRWWQLPAFSLPLFYSPISVLSLKITCIISYCTVSLTPLPLDLCSHSDPSFWRNFKRSLLWPGRHRAWVRNLTHLGLHTVPSLTNCTTLGRYLTSLILSFLTYKMLMILLKGWATLYQSIRIGAQLEMRWVWIF